MEKIQTNIIFKPNMEVIRKFSNEVGTVINIIDEFSVSVKYPNTRFPQIEFVDHLKIANQYLCSA